jgi:hypothetical protein
MIYNASIDGNIVNRPGIPMASPKTPRVIASNRLTNCAVVDKGRAIHLGFLDDNEQPLAVEFPFDQALSLIMTLPHLIGRAVTLQTKDPTARCVFSLKQWAIERVDDDSLIVTLSTEDGFAVSFSVPLSTCKAMGFALRQESKAADEHSDEGLRSDSPHVLN